MWKPIFHLVPEDTDRGRFIRDVILVTLLFTAIGFGIYSLITVPEIINNRKQIEVSQKTVVELQNDYLKQNVSEIDGDLMYLREMHMLRAYVSEEDPLLKASLRLDVEEEFIKFMAVNSNYDQLRYLDETGMEIIRVNQSGEDIYAVEEEALQDKSGRYYFEETMIIEYDDVYQSPLDLNIEKGMIEEPHKPMVRFGVKVMDDEGMVTGILLINYNSAEMLDAFDRISQNVEGGGILLNTDGYYLTGREGWDFAFMWEESADMSFSREFPEVWRQMNAEEIEDTTLQLYCSKGIFTIMETVALDETRHETHWYNISFVDASDNDYMTDKSMGVLLLQHYLRLWYLVIPLLLVAWMLVTLMTYRRIHLASITKLARIDHLTGTFNRHAGMEILESGMVYALKNDMEFSLCFIDLNDLKKVNDLHGHEMGDRYLKETVAIIRSCFRDSDQLIRMGGDEFLIGLHGDRAVTEKNWRKVLEKVAWINELEGRPYTISLSHGVASVREEAIEDVDTLIAFADERMYIEKRKMKDDRK